MYIPESIIGFAAGYFMGIITILVLAACLNKRGKKDGK